MSFKPTPSRPFASGVWGRSGRVYRPRANGNTQSLIGVTQTSGGVALANCIVKLYLSANNVLLVQTTSDAAGNFRFDNPGTGPFYIRAYKEGVPDVAGITGNRLMPA